MNRLHVFIIISIGIGIAFIESSSSNDILLLYIVLHTNPIQCIWIRPPYMLPSEAATVCTQEGGKRIRLYIERRKMSTIIYRVTRRRGRKVITGFCIRESITFLSPSEKAVVIVIFYYYYYKKEIVVFFFALKFSTRSLSYSVSNHILLS